MDAGANASAWHVDGSGLGATTQTGGLHRELVRLPVPPPGELMVAGDLVLFEDEVNAAMSAALEGALSAAARLPPRSRSAQLLSSSLRCRSPACSVRSSRMTGRSPAHGAK